jgi:glycosyltransferase involved in cell wall biosynthesis
MMPKQRGESGRVLFVHDGPMHLDPHGIAVSVYYTQSLIERYRRLAAHITFAMRTEVQRSDRHAPRLSAANFEVVPLPDPKGPLRYLRHAAEGKRKLRALVEQHDVIVTRLPSTLGSWAFKEALAQRKPVIVEFVGCTFDSMWNYGWKGKCVAPYLYLKNQRLVRKATHIIYVTERFLQQRYPSPAHQVSVSNVEVPARDESILESRLQRIAQRGTTLILATAAALDVPYKEQRTVISAVAKLKQSGVIVHYRMAGNGTGRELIEHARALNVLDQIEILGALPHNRMHEFLDAADIYVQPSRQEGLPRALIEAMSRGMPCIGSDAGGIPELLPNKRIFRRGRVSELVRTLQEALDSDLAQDAIRNWQFASRYERSVLDLKRSTFYDEFLRSERER